MKSMFLKISGLICALSLAQGAFAVKPKGVPETAANDKKIQTAAVQDANKKFGSYFGQVVNHGAMRKKGFLPTQNGSALAYVFSLTEAQAAAGRSLCQSQNSLNDVVVTAEQRELLGIKENECFKTDAKGCHVKVDKDKCEKAIRLMAGNNKEAKDTPVIGVPTKKTTSQQGKRGVQITMSPSLFGNYAYAAGNNKLVSSYTQGARAAGSSMVANHNKQSGTQKTAKSLKK